MSFFQELCISCEALFVSWPKERAVTLHQRSFGSLGHAKSQCYSSMRSAGSGSLQSDPGAPWGDGVQEPLPSGGVRDLLGLNIPSMASSGHAAPAHCGVLLLSQGDGTSPCGSFYSVTPFKPCWQSPAPLSWELSCGCCQAWDPCTNVAQILWDIIIDLSPTEIKLMLRLAAFFSVGFWISVGWRSSSAGIKTLFLVVFVPACPCQVSAAPRSTMAGVELSREKMVTYLPWKLCGKSDLLLLFYHIFWASYLIQVKPKLLNRTLMQHADQINEVWV